MKPNRARLFISPKNLKVLEDVPKLTNRSKTTPKKLTLDIAVYSDLFETALYINGKYVTTFEDPEVEIELILLLQHTGCLKATINRHYIDYDMDDENGEVFPIKFKDLRLSESEFNIHMDGED